MEAEQIRITCEQLNDLIKAGGIKVIDACISPNAETIYKMIALPRALLFRIADVRDKSVSLPNTWPTVEIVTQRCRELGLHLDDQIVLYDQPSNTLGVYRTRFILLAHGFKNVKILEGGLAKWFSKNLEVAPGKGDPEAPSDLPNLICDTSRTVSID